MTNPDPRSDDFGEAEEVAHAILFAEWNFSDIISVQVLMVDDGRTIK
jgi:hypothetical protein